MSCYETHKGILRKVDTKGKSIREFLHDIALGEDEDEAFRLVSEGEGETFDCYDIDTYGPSGNSCDLVSVEECE